ncbi:MAG: hypothetical protein RMK89_12685 [Armatimonadota bacterium]|nr:hypothetical protein [Armatimonadota bacterium]MDW8144305.1 hypothetical protein [Armatimonadota bacterium]
MKTFKLSIEQIAQMDLVQIYAIVEGYKRLDQSSQRFSLDEEVWDVLRRLR